MSTLDDLDRQLLDDLRSLPGWDALPASTAPMTSDENLLRSTAAVRDAIAADMTRTVNADLIRSGVRPISSGRHRRYGRWAVAAIAGVAAAALLIVAPTVSAPGSSPVSVASASEFLTHLAATTTAASGLDDAYWKVTFTAADSPVPSSGKEHTVTSWYGRDGGTWTSLDGGAVLSSGLTGPTDGDAQFLVSPDVGLSWTQVIELPNDPVPLEARLRSLIGSKESIVDASAVLLAEAPLNAGQRGALFTILSRQPDVAIRHGVKDAIGRTGTALDFPGTPHTLNGDQALALVRGRNLDPTETWTLLLADDGTLLQSVRIRKNDIRDRETYQRETFAEVGGTNTAPGT